MKTVELTQGYVALVSDEDYDRVLAAGPWSVNIKKRKDGSIMSLYAKHTNQDGKMVYLHRFILGLSDPKIQADHRDRNGLNCQRENLRVATHIENSRNKVKQRNNSSGYKGVTWHKSGKKWQAATASNKKYIHIGLFDTPEDAAKAYDKMVTRLFGEFARTNF